MGGTNLCVDIGAVGFSPMSEDRQMTKDIGNFPKFPPGCAEAKECRDGPALDRDGQCSDPDPNR